MKPVELFPSLMAADPLNLTDVITLLDPHVDGYHLDIMDGQFVPNTTWGPATVNAIASATRKPLCAHLMVIDPAWWLERLELTTGTTIVFHHSAVAKPAALISQIQRKRWDVGVALSPKTAVSEIESLLSSIDLVLVMSVQPGFAGQEFIASSLKKIEQLAQLKRDQQATFTIAVDGGINHETILDVVKAGAQRVAIGSGIFEHSDPVAAIASLRRVLAK